MYTLVHFARLGSLPPLVPLANADHIFHCQTTPILTGGRDEEAIGIQPRRNDASGADHQLAVTGPMYDLHNLLAAIRFVQTRTRFFFFFLAWLRWVC